MNSINNSVIIDISKVHLKVLKSLPFLLKILIKLNYALVYILFFVIFYTSLRNLAVYCFSTFTCILICLSFILVFLSKYCLPTQQILSYFVSDSTNVYFFQKREVLLFSNHINCLNCNLYRHIRLFLFQVKCTCYILQVMLSWKFTRWKQTHNLLPNFASTLFISKFQQNNF